MGLPVICPVFVSNLSPLGRTGAILKDSTIPPVDEGAMTGAAVFWNRT